MRYLRFIKKYLLASRKMILMIIVVVVSTLLVSAAISMWLSSVYDVRVPSVGTIVTFGVEAYWDSDCKNHTGNVDWGLLSPGSSETVTIYLRSASNLMVKFYLAATNWNPANISSYINLSWNYNDTFVAPNEVIPVVLTLQTSSVGSFINYLTENRVEEFSFDIYISVSED